MFFFIHSSCGFYTNLFRTANIIVKAHRVLILKTFVYIYTKKHDKIHNLYILILETIIRLAYTTNMYIQLAGHDAANQVDH